MQNLKSSRAVLLVRLIAVGLLLQVGSVSVLAAAPSGVSGKVTVSPTCPGGQRLDEDCASPLADARVLLIDRSGKTVSAAKTAANGRFEISAPAGTYLVEVASSGRLPRCPPSEVTVKSGKQTWVDIACDSGMR